MEEIRDINIESSGDEIICSPKSHGRGVLHSSPDLTDMPAIKDLKAKYKQLEKPDEKYYWKWEVSTEDYEEIRRLLINVDFSERTRDKIRICAPQLAFYIAEWYKREYDGFESENCLESIGIPSSSFNKDIWEYSHSPEERPYCTADTNINEWLYSMYVMGGFPIKYTKRSSRFSSLFDNIWGDDQEQDVISEEQLNEITQGFDGNQVIKNSLMSGSLHDYYRYLRIQETMPIAESDKDKDPFADFIRNLQEGKKKYYEQYIKPIWLLYLDPNEDIIEGYVRISFGKKDDKCYIPYECLEYWNVPHLNTVQEFDIEVSSKDSADVKKNIHFSKTGPGNSPFAGWSRDNVITLPINPCNNESICVSLVVNGSDKFQIDRPFTFGDSRQFFKTNKPYEWSSKTDNSAHTAVLYNPISLKLSDEKTLLPEDRPKEKYFEEDGQAWMWMVLNDKVILNSSDGSPIIYAPQNHSLEFSFKTKKETIKYSNFRDVVYYQRIEDELVQTAVPLLYERGLTVLYTPYGSKNAEKLERSQYDLFYKCEGDSRYNPWGKDSTVTQGLIQLKAVCKKNGASATKQVYYIPNPEPIRRLPNENKIIFNGLSDIYFPDSDSYVALCKDDNGIMIYTDDIVSGYMPQSDTIPFRIGQPDESYLEINVYRSCICKELYLRNLSEPIRRYDGSRGMVEIPFVLRHNFEVRTINENGVSRTKCGEDVYMRFDTDDVIIDNENGFKYYNTTKRYNLACSNPENVEIQLETGPAEYRFYYWSMEVGEEPVLLEQVYDEGTKKLTVDTSYLAKNKSGIVFQSLRGVSPRHYITPVEGSKRSQRYEVKCFEVACEHEIPFQVFPCLKDIFLKSKDSHDFDNLGRFWVDFMRKRKWAPVGKDLKNLHRFAYEFLFDWILIPKRFWVSTLLKDDFDPSIGIKNPVCRETMTKLFRTSPYLQKENKEYLERILELYWDIYFLRWDFTKRSSKTENLFLQCLRGLFKTTKSQSDYSCLEDDYELRISRLKAFHNDSTLYEKVYRLMVQQINNK